MDCGVVEGESILHEVLLLQAEKVKVMKHNLKKNNTFIVVANLSNMSFDVRKSLQEAVPNISKWFLLKKLTFTVLWFLAMDEIFELWIEITVTFDVCWTAEMTNFRQNTSSCGQIQPDYIHFHSFNIWDPTQALDHKWYEEKIFKMLLSSGYWQKTVNLHSMKPLPSKPFLAQSD